MNSRVLGALSAALLSIALVAAYALAQGNGYSGSPSTGSSFVLDSGSVILNGNVTGPANANTVVQVQNVGVSSTTPTSGQFFILSDAGVWTPTSLSGEITCSTTNPGQCFVDAGGVILAGNVTGPANANTVVQIQNVGVSSTGPTPGQFFILSDAGVWTATNLSGEITCSTTTPGQCFVDAGGITLSGDVTGLANANRVVGIESLPIAGSGSQFQFLILNDAGTGWIYTSGYPYASNLNNTGSAVAVAAGTNPSTVITSVSFTPKYTGRVRVICYAAVQATNNFGDTVNIGFSRGASPANDDADLPPVSLFGPANSTVDMTGIIEYGTPYGTGLLAPLTVGTTYQMNCAVGSVDGAAQVPNDGVQITVQELP